MELKPKFDVSYMEEALLVIATHGFVKKTQKTPESELAHAEALRKKYYDEKNK